MDIPNQYVEPDVDNQSLDDPFIDNVIRNLPAEIKYSFTTEQFEALVSALSKAHIGARHMIDARVTLSLFFTRFYVVFLVGKDRRRKTRLAMIERRQKASFVVGSTLISMLVFYAIIGFIIIFLMLMYLLKSFLGIDIFPDEHLAGLLNKWLEMGFFD